MSTALSTAAVGDATVAEVAPPLSWAQLAGGALFVVILWEAFKAALRACLPGLLGTPRLHRTRPSGSDADHDFQDLPVPVEPHAEIALHPPCGLHCSNPSEPYDYDNDYTCGSYLYFHPPRGPSTAFGPEGMDYDEYFKSKSRLWEMRIRMHFKRSPASDADLFFGVELEDDEKYVPLSAGTRQTQKIVLSAAKQAMPGLYHSAGDDPQAVQGEAEKPVCVLPLWVLDQFIVTPEGEEPPSLSDPDFGNLGKKRYNRVAQYAEEIAALKSSLRPGPTYTFAVWGNSRFLDVINWQVVGIPIATPCDFDKFAGRPPVHVVLYTLKPSEDGEQRHLQSRKEYFFKASIWSSLRRPPRHRIEVLTGASERGHLGPLSEAMSQKKKSVRRRIASFLRGSVNDGIHACIGRPRH